MSLGSMALIAAVFTLSATTSENFDSCSTSVSSHCMTAHLELIHVLGALWRYEPRQRRSLFHHCSGLEPLRDCVPSLKSVSRAHTENPPYQRCHLSAGARDQSSCHSCTQLLDIPEAPPKDFQSCCLQTFPAWRPLSTRLPHSLPSETQNHRSQDGSHQTVVVSVFQVPCWFSLRSCCEPELDMAVVVRAKVS